MIQEKQKQDVIIQKEPERNARNKRKSLLLKALIENKLITIRDLTEIVFDCDNEADLVYRYGVERIIANDNVSIFTFFLEDCDQENIENLVGNNNSLLHIAASYGSIGIVQHLVENYPKLLNKMNSKKKTPLDSAKKYQSLQGFSEVIEYLISQGAESGKRSNSGSNSSSSSSSSSNSSSSSSSSSSGSSSSSSSSFSSSLPSRDTATTANTGLGIKNSLELHQPNQGKRKAKSNSSNSQKVAKKKIKKAGSKKKRP